MDFSEAGWESHLLQVQKGETQGEATRILRAGRSQVMEERLGLLTETGEGAAASGQRGLRGRMGFID